LFKAVIGPLAAAASGAWAGSVGGTIGVDGLVPAVAIGV
jgi:hypothetical protein